MKLNKNIHLKEKDASPVVSLMNTESGNSMKNSTAHNTRQFYENYTFTDKVIVGKSLSFRVNLLRPKQQKRDTDFVINVNSGHTIYSEGRGSK